jgi:thioredoxin-like negative regulator of GroEL
MTGTTTGVAHGMRQTARGTSSADDRPLLLFFVEKTSGPCRRMKGLVASLEVTRKARLRVAEVDVDAQPELARRLGIVSTPTLVLVTRGRPAARLEGRVTGKQIDAMLRPFIGS